MSVLIEGLVQRGFVNRTPDKLDRRRVLLTLTPEGERQHTQALDGTAAWLVEVLEPLDEHQRRAIVEAFEIMRPLFSNVAAASTSNQGSQVAV